MQIVAVKDDRARRKRKRTEAQEHLRKRKKERSDRLAIQTGALPKDNGTSDAEPIIPIEMDGPVTIGQLPTEILEHIFLCLPIHQMATLNRVCRDWKAISDNDTLWKEVFATHFGIPPMMTYSWKHRSLIVNKRKIIYEVDAHDSVDARLLWSSQHGYSQYFKYVPSSITAAININL